MTALKEIDAVKKNIDSTCTKRIKLLHKLIFGIDGDRKNRARLREFSGLGFELNSDKFYAKLHCS